ncbi:MAG: hypothetical protein M3P51_06785 [Chloroflexota bacterium]|nr:hypothetical protein [Chloroflexota bacterium]
MSREREAAKQLVDLMQPVSAARLDDLHGRSPSWKRREPSPGLAVMLGIVTILVLVISLALFSSIEHPSLDALLVGAPAAVEPHDIQGTLVITGGVSGADDLESCLVVEGQAPIVELVLRDENGRLLGRSQVEPGRYPMNYGCRLPYTFEDVPMVRTYNFFLTANPNDVFVSYSLAQMQARDWRVDFEIPIR